MIYSLNASKIPELKAVGGKAKALIETANAGFPVPAGFVLSVDFLSPWMEELKKSKAWEAFVKAPGKENCDALKETAGQFKFNGSQKEEIAKAMKEIPAPGLLAVRSSSPEEDLEGASFAGGYETTLGVTADSLEEAVVHSFFSMLDVRVLEYKKQHKMPLDNPRIAVIVQKQIAADVSGVGFSQNPQNGEEDEVMLNSNFGLGESVVSGQVTPDIYIVKGKKLKKKIAHKQTALYLKEDGGVEETIPAKPELSSLSNKQVRLLSALVKKVEAYYNKPIDIEWAIEKKKIYLLQARPITTKGAVLSWKVKPKIKGTIYVRGSIVELQPDPLCPLYADFTKRHVPSSLSKLMKTLVGEDFEKMVSAMEFSTVNGYAYYSMALKLSMFLPIIGKIGMMLKLFNQPPVWIEEEKLPAIKKRLKELEKTDLKTSTPKALHEMAHELTETICVYYTYCQLYLAQAYKAEGLFILFYDKKIKPKTGIPSHVLILGEDSAPIMADKALYELAVKLGKDAALKKILLETGDINELLKDENPALSEFKKLFAAYLELHANMIYDLDFLKPTPKDDPHPIFETLKLYLSGNGENPIKRQQKALAKREEAEQEVKKVVSARIYKKFQKKLADARAKAPYRENGLANVGLCQPFLRKVLFELGERLKSAGIIEDSGDIFWLKEEELDNFVAGNEQEPLDKEISRRKELWKKQKKANCPAMLPRGAKIFGFSIGAFLPKEIDETSNLKIFKGNGVSSGKITGKARILLSVDEFPQMKQGEILVAPMTTPAWTPLFALAAGVVTDFGGPLSHSSIVAREYGIPAVLGTGGTSKIIKTGQTITVDGDKGEVRIEEE